MTVADVHSVRRHGGADGGRCRQPGMLPSGRCRMHGGRTPRGLASPLTKTGRYSRDLPTRVLTPLRVGPGRSRAALGPDDIALLQGSIQEVMAEIREAEARPDLDAILGMVERISSDWQGWDWTRMSASWRRSRARSPASSRPGQRCARSAS